MTNILAYRAITHGDFASKSTFIQCLKAEMREAPNWFLLADAQGEALDLIATKIGRILYGDPNFADHWDDIAGYAALGGVDGKQA